MTNSRSLLPRTGEGVVIDIGTGDGRFVSALAAANPNKFFIGIDANVKPLKKPSMRATRKAAKGGLPNAMFIQAAVEDLPTELDGVADEIHIHFPWGSLLRSVVKGEREVIASLRRIAARECQLEVVIGIDRERDRGEIERLGLPEITAEYLRQTLVPKFEATGFALREIGRLDRDEWSKLETSWARRLGSGSAREVTYFVLVAV